MIRILIAGHPDQTHNYTAAVAAFGMEPIVSLRLSQQNHTPACGGIDDYDGLILPGGADVDPARYGQPVYGSRRINPQLDDAQFSILDAFVKSGKPVLGICKGHQIINIYFGGDLIQDLPEPQVSRHCYDTGDKVHLSHTEPDSWLAHLYGTRFATNSAHHQAVGQVAPGFHAIQHSDDGVIEAIAHESLPILSLQWHPERMCCEHKREDTADGSKVFLYLKELCQG